MSTSLLSCLQQAFPENFGITSDGDVTLEIRDLTADRATGYLILVTAEATFTEAVIEFGDFAGSLMQHADRKLREGTFPLQLMFSGEPGWYARQYRTLRTGLFTAGAGERESSRRLVLGRRENNLRDPEGFADMLLAFILFIFPYDIAAEEEGAPEEIWISRYERSRLNRALCLAYHGYNCTACGINLREVYGEVARSFIHVHHLNPLAVTGSRVPDPVKEMCPLCPNCHAIAHRRNPPFTPEEIKNMLKQQSL